MNEVQKEKSSLESKLEEDRKKFENEMQKMIDKQKQSEVGMSAADVFYTFTIMSQCFIRNLLRASIRGREERV